MKITRVSAVVYSQDLILTGPPPRFAGEPRQAFQTLLVKVETDAGLTGWGEAFCHRVWPGVKSALETLIAPHCIGADPTAIAPLMETLTRRVYGVRPHRAGDVRAVGARHRAVGHSRQGREPAAAHAARRRAP